MIARSTQSSRWRIRSKLSNPEERGQANENRKPKPLLQKIYNQAVAQATGDIKKALEASAFDLQYVPQLLRKQG